MTGRIQVKEMLDKQALQRDEDFALSREIAQELSRLVQLPAYGYLKRMAFGILLKPYRCDPPTSDAEREKWETYNKIRWAIERLFNLVEMYAKNPQLAKDLK